MILLVGLLVLIILLISVVFLTRLDREQIYHEYATSKAYADAQEKFQIECSDLASVEEIRQCFSDIIETSRYPQRAEEDLRAQKEMAQWAFWMLITTWFIGVVSIGVAITGIFWIIRTWELQRVATEQSVQATRAAIEANALNRDTFIMQQRAWLALRSIIPCSPLKWSHRQGSAGFEFLIENTGATPALNVVINGRIHVQSANHPHYKDHLELAEQRSSPKYGITMFPGKDRPRRFGFHIRESDMKRRFDERGIDGWTQPMSLTLTLIGFIEYDLVFKDGVRHKTPFVFSIMRMPDDPTQEQRPSNLQIGPMFGDIPAEKIHLHWRVEQPSIAD